MNILRLQDNPIVAQACLLLISLATLNYLFLAFGKNPLAAILPGGTFQNIVFVIIGLLGLQLLIKSFNIVQIFPRIRDLAQSGYNAARSAMGKAQDEIKTLENYRNRYQCACGK